jgi:hypothetical protein
MMYGIADQVGEDLAQPAKVRANDEVLWNIHVDLDTLGCQRLSHIFNERRQRHVGGLEPPDALLDAADIQQIPRERGDRIDIRERTLQAFDVARAFFPARVAQEQFKATAQWSEVVPEVVSQDRDKLFGG